MYEIWRVELDLKGFVFIAGSPCPCQSKKCQTENPDQGQHKVPTCGGLWKVCVIYFIKGVLALCGLSSPSQLFIETL